MTFISRLSVAIITDLLALRAITASLEISHTTGFSKLLCAITFDHYSLDDAKSGRYF